MLGALPLAVALLVAVAVAPLTSALYSRGDDVVELTAKNFQSRVLDSPDVWLVEFYAPWCGHCKNLAPSYKKTATNLRGIVSVGAIDCNEESNKPTCGRYGIQGFPTIKAFPGLKRGDKKLPVDYQGPRTAPGMVEYALGRLSDKIVLKVDDEPGVETLLKQGKAVLLFTDKTTTAPLFKALAQRYADRGLFFGEARKKSADALIKKFEVTKFPSLMIVQRGDTGKIDVIDYFGALKAVELEQFLNKHTPGYDGADKPVLKKLEPFNPIIPKLSTQADLERECLTKANAGLSTLCVFALLPPLEEEFPESVEQHKQLIATIAAVKRHFFEQTEKEVIAAAKAASEDGTTSASLLPTYLFSWMDGTAPEATKFVSKFGLSSDLPSMMVLSVTKKAYRPFIGVFEAADIQRFLVDTARGRGRVFQYQWELVLGEKSTSADPIDTDKVLPDGAVVPPNEDVDHDEL